MPSPAMWNSGATVICRSPRRTSDVAIMLLSQAMFARCDTSAPLGRPVVPLVYIMNSASSSVAPIGGSWVEAAAIAAAVSSASTSIQRMRGNCSRNGATSVARSAPYSTAEAPLSISW